MTARADWPRPGSRSTRRLADAVHIGFRAAAPHTNSHHFVHGLLSALADNATGLSCGIGLKEGAGLVTVSLTMDFLASAALGQWIELRPSVTKLGGSLAFATRDRARKRGGLRQRTCGLSGGGATSSRLTGHVTPIFLRICAA